MQRSLQVVIRQKFVLWMLKSPAHPPILMQKEFQSLVYILHFLGGNRNDRLNEFVMAKIVRAERNSILQPLLICLSVM
jgi:hypothetical protein